MARVILSDINSELPNYTVDYVLGDTNYRFKSIWNERANMWSIDISLAVDNTPLINGRGLSTNVNLYERFADSRLPNGIMFVMDTQTEDADTDPTRDSLGSQHLVIYDDLED